jgi:peptide/nickel transport system permease protein
VAEFSVINRHAVRNSLIPVVTLIALSAPTVFSGALITEQIFRVPGIGSLLITSIQNNDIPVIMAILVTFSFLVVMFNLIADIVYGVLDPRIRYD